MNIAILSKGPHLYSTRSLLRAGIRRGHQMKVIDYTRCNFVFERGGCRIFYDNYALRHFDAIIPRIGTSFTEKGAAVIGLFEMMNVFTTARSDALLLARNKLRSLQKLARCGVDVPKTVFPNLGQDARHLVRQLGGLPVIIKLQEGTHGIGVILGETLNQVEATVEAFFRFDSNVILQEYIKESNGSDVRAIVVSGEIMAVMERRAADGDFRSNLHRGATSCMVQLTPEEEHIIKNAVRVIGLDVAGVDLIRSARGPLILEVNASPGLEGIESTTKVDVAGSIIDFIENRVKELKNYRNSLNKIKPKPK